MEKEFRDWLISKLAAWQGCATTEIDETLPFKTLGIHGKKALLLAQEIGHYLHKPFSSSLFYSYPSIAKLATFLFNSAPESEMLSPTTSIMEPIAIIGMACRTAGANNIDAFWQLLSEGKNTLAPIATAKWQQYGNHVDEGQMHPKTAWGGFLENKLDFDCHLFNINPTELEETDPQQRLLLELSWEAIEHARYAPSSLEDKNVGVYIGIHNSDYFRLNVQNTQQMNAQTIPGGALSIAAGRIAYQFGFNGPAIAIDTACSSSLMAIHLACQSLRLQECTLALAGGINLIFSPHYLLGLTEARILSPSGRCHTFDDKADGYVRAEGCGILVLKPLKQALADNDLIRAVISGSAANNDGHSNGLTAPNKRAQIAVVKKALANSGLEPSQIDYIEAHGTGTVLGDLVELEALHEVFKERVDNKIPVGSVKTNIGHTETAAGVLGLMKVILALERETIPKHLGFETPNSHIAWEKLGLSVPTRNLSWKKQAHRKRHSGISAFGFSGTNVHLILSEPPSPKIFIPSESLNRYTLFISAAEEEALYQLGESYAKFLQENASISMTDFCYAVNHSRSHLKVGVVLHASDKKDMMEQLSHLRQNPALIGKGRKMQEFLPAGQKIDLPTYPFQRKKFLKPFSAKEDDLSVQKNIYSMLLDILKPSNKTLEFTLSLDQYGLNSLLAMSLRNAFEKKYQIHLPLHTLMSGLSISSLILFIENAIQNKEPIATLKPAEETKKEKKFYSLSYNQNQLAFLQDLCPKTAAYNLPICLKLKGNVQTIILEKSLNDLVKNHEILRINILKVEKELKQKTNPFVYQKISLIDLSKIPKDQADQELKIVIKTEASLPFDLYQDRLYRFKLIKLEDDSYFLMLIFHHIIIDGWSLLEIILPQLFQQYNAYLQGFNPEPIKTKINYFDYAEQKSTEKRDDDLQYWYKKLDNAKLNSALGTDYLRPPNTAYLGKREQIILNEGLSEKIKQFNCRYHQSIFSILFSALFLTLSRFIREDDIIIGTTFSNRHSKDMEEIVGDLTNHLPIRMVIEEQDKPLQFIEKISQLILEAFEHAHCPIQQIVKKINPKRMGNRNPLYNIACVMHSFSALARSWELIDNTEVSFLTASGQVDNGTSEIELLIEIIQNKKNFILEYEFDTEIFDEQTLVSFFNTYQIILDQLLQTDQPINKITNTLDNNSITEVKKSKTKSFSEKKLHHIFEQHVDNYPHSPALIYEKKSLTYLQLNNEANKFARKLLKVQNKSNQTIAIFAEPSFEYIIAILGILKTNNHYLPLDPQYPTGYVTTIIEDASVELLVHGKRLKSKLPSHPGLKLIEIDYPILETDESVHPKYPSTDQDTAYIIYTSGSTGQPKGVAISHYNVIRLLETTQAYFDFNKDDSWALFHSPAFDFSVWELWGALSTGGTLVILPFLSIRTPAELYQNLIDQQITILNQTPSAFKQFLSYYQTINPTPLFQLRYIIFGGEKLETASLKIWIERHGDASPQLVNMYGITEITVHATYKRITAPVDNYQHYSGSIGKALPDLNIYILDKNKNLLPQGAVGEIYISGQGLAQGYWNKPLLTDERFIKNFLDHDSVKLYCSGDLGRYLPNGEIQYLNRVDDQIKWHGFRVELNYIEKQIKKLPYIQDTLILLDKHPRSENLQLLAFIEPNLDYIFSTVQQNKLSFSSAWQDIFNATYKQECPSSQDILNYIGWNNSYTGQRLAENEMQDWVDMTLAEIRRLPTKHILEIGAGTGMLLFPLLEECLSYTATDQSQSAIDYIRGVLLTKKVDSKNITLYCQEAHSFENLIKDHYDLIIINSVVQYFPDLNYLSQLIASLGNYLAKDGVIFIGDLRNYITNPWFYLSVCFNQAQDETNISEIVRRYKQKNIDENELLIAPDYFHKIQQDNSRMTGFRLSSKQGTFLNEMSKYRYNAILFMDQPLTTLSVDTKILWDETLQLTDIKAILEKHPCKVIHISQIVDKSLELDNALYHYCTTPLNAYATKKTCTDNLKQEKQIGLHPNTLTILAESYQYQVHITPSYPKNKSLVFDCYFFQQTGKKPFSIPSNNKERDERISNFIPFHALNKLLLPLITKEIAVHLPQYMHPSNYLLLDKFPLTINGKVDKKELLSFRLDQTQVKGHYVAPQNALEKAVIEILEELLACKISMTDKFFDIGGNSILATQFVLKIKQDLGLDLPLILIFNNPSITELVKHLTEILIQESKTLLASEEIA